MARSERRLEDLVSIGPAMLRDFELLGIRTVEQLARHEPEHLYEKLCRITGESQDICCLDVFSAAVAQARNPRLPVVRRQWWYWSRKRKAGERRIDDRGLTKAIPNSKFQIQDFRLKIPDSRLRLQDSRFKEPDSQIPNP